MSGERSIFLTRRSSFSRDGLVMGPERAVRMLNVWRGRRGIVHVRCRTALDPAGLALPCTWCRRPDERLKYC
jgi:hypothetical protein